MAVDSTLFAATVPAGTYSVGDRINLGVIRGPQVVRDGYGKAIFKRFFTTKTAVDLGWSIHLKNSNWVDEMSNVAVTAQTAETLLDNESAALQNGHDADLQPNSGWECYAICFEGGTTTAACDLLALIDIDYPSVLAVQNPREAQGEPITIEETFNVNQTPVGSVATGALWNSYNRDVFKAGYRYLLTEMGIHQPNGVVGFVSISGAAGQAGLERIIPSRAAVLGSKFPLDYSTPLVKGPMNINILSIGGGSAKSEYTYLDFVKKKL